MNPSRSTGRPRRPRGAINQARAHTKSSGGVVSSNRLALWITVKSRVALLMPNSPERRVTTRGPKATGPTFRGPQCTSSQLRPVWLGGRPSAPAGAKRSSVGGRLGLAALPLPAGSRAERQPTNRARASSRGRLRRHRRQERPLRAVTSSSRPTRARRQRGPARIGVSRKARVQASFWRASSWRNQLPLPGTYWPIGICRSQSISRYSPALGGPSSSPPEPSTDP